MDALTATIKTVIQATGTKNRYAGQTLDTSVNYTASKAINTGTGAGQANEMYDFIRTLASGATETLDLSGTSLQNAFGENIVFTGVKIVYVENLSTTETLTIGNATSNQWLAWLGGATNTETIPPGGILLRTNLSATGWAVTNSSADQLKIANSGGASTSYRIILMGDLA